MGYTLEFYYLLCSWQRTYKRNLLNYSCLQSKMGFHLAHSIHRPKGKAYNLHENFALKAFLGCTQPMESHLLCQMMYGCLWKEDWKWLHGKQWWRCIEGWMSCYLDVPSETCSDKNWWLKNSSNVRRSTGRILMHYELRIMKEAMHLWHHISRINISHNSVLWMKFM